MEKVKVTRAQAEAIDYFKKTFVENRETSMSNEKLARALSKGYEVEPEWKAFDWYYNESKKEVHQASVKLAEGFNEYPELYKHIRHATEQEIAQEKERRWWSEHDRGYREFKKGDVLKINEILCIVDALFFISSDMEKAKNGLFKVVTFTENRLDGDTE